MESTVDETATRSALLADADPFSRRVLTSLLVTPIRLFIHFVAFIVFCMVAMRMVPQYVTVFEERDMALIPLTIGVIRFSFWMVRFWYLLGLGVIFVNGVVLFVLQLLPRRQRWIGQVWFALVLLGFLLAIGWIVFVTTSQLSFGERVDRNSPRQVED